MNFKLSAAACLTLTVLISCSDKSTEAGGVNAAEYSITSDSFRFKLLKTYEPVEFNIRGVQTKLCFSGTVSAHENKYEYYESCDDKTSGEKYIVNAEINKIVADTGHDIFNPVLSSKDFLVLHTINQGSVITFYDLTKVGSVGYHLSCNSGWSAHPGHPGFDNNSAKVVCLSKHDGAYRVRVIKYSGAGLDRQFAEYDIDAGYLIGGTDKNFYYRSYANPDLVSVRSIDDGHTVKTIDAMLPADKSNIYFGHYVVTEQGSELSVTDLDTGNTCHLNYPYVYNLSSLSGQDPMQENSEAYTVMRRVDGASGTTSLHMVDLKSCKTLGYLWSFHDKDTIRLPEPYAPTMRDKTFVWIGTSRNLELRGFNGSVLDKMNYSGSLYFTNGHKFVIRHDDGKTQLYSF